MILRPSAANVLGAVRASLRTSAAPAVRDPLVLAELGMIDTILGTVIERCAAEQRFIVEEVTSIEAVAKTVVRETADERVIEAVAALEAANESARYEAASELLSRCLEVAVRTGGELRPTVESVLWQRMEHQSQIHRWFEVHGR